jgi:hypothetical protein
MVKKEFHFLFYFFKEYEWRYSHLKIFENFFNSPHFSLFKADQTSLEYKELGSVEIFRLSFTVPEI